MPEDEAVAAPELEALALAASTLMESLDIIRALELIASGHVEAVTPNYADEDLTTEQKLDLIAQVTKDYLVEAESARQLLILLTA